MSPSTPSVADRILALTAAINHLRSAREQLASQELCGSVDIVAGAQAQLRRQLAQLAEEGIGLIAIPDLEAIRL